MAEFKYVFQITKMVVFEVNYYTLLSNKNPYFSTTSNVFEYGKRDYKISGQCQEDVLPKKSAAYRFYKKWDHMHLKNPDEEQLAEIRRDLEKLKSQYNYICNERETFAGVSHHISFSKIKDLSKMKIKNPTKE